MAVSDVELAAALRLGDGATALEAPLASIIARLNGAAGVIVDEYADSAPAAVKDEATIRIAGYLYDNDGSRNRRFADVLANSGALSVLSPFRMQRALALDETVAEQDRDMPEEAMVQTPPPRGVKLYTIDFANPGALYNDIAAMTGAELVAAGAEALANVERGVSLGGPVQCWRQVFEYTRSVDFQWLAVAIPNDAIPSHYQIRLASPLYPFNEGVWPSSTIQAGSTWIEGSGAVSLGGIAYTAFFWPQIVRASAGERTSFEWVI